MNVLIPILIIILIAVSVYWAVISHTVLKNSVNTYTMPQPTPTPSCERGNSVKPSCNCAESVGEVLMPPSEVSAEIREFSPITEESYCSRRLSADMCTPCRGKYPIDFPVPACIDDKLECNSCMQTLKYKLQ